MTSVWRHLQSGDWLTRERLRAYCAILLCAYAMASVGWIALSDGLIDRNGKPLGTDFSNPYAAGTLVWQGRAAQAYDPPTQHAAERAVFAHADVPFYGWHYPPFFFGIAALMALFPYAWALALWLATSFAAYLAAMRAILPRAETWFVAAAFPAVFVNLGHGQNGFLTAALLGGALHLLDKSPLVSGMLIGMLAYKPQFGLLIPLVLIATGRWRVIASATATVLALASIVTLALGSDIWAAFAASSDFTKHVILENGSTGFEKIQSAFAAARAWGASVPQAYTAQIAVSVAVAASLTWLWRTGAAYALKAASLALGCLLVTPYVLDYDLMVLAIAAIFVVRHGLDNGFRSGEITVLAATFIAPLVTRSIAGLTNLPLGLIIMVLLYGMILRRAVYDLGGVKPRALAQA